jgi:signal transduction histidine kinase
VKSTLPGVLPDPGEDPRIQALIREEYTESDRLRGALLAGVFFLATGFFLTMWILTTLGATPLEASVRPKLLASAVAGAILGTLELGLRSYATRTQGGGRRALFWYGTTVLEVGIITTVWLTFGTLLPAPSSLFPGAVVFAALTVISALRLDWRITLFTGVLCAIASTTIYIVLTPGPLPPAPRPGLLGSANALVTIGVLAGLVAEQARRRTFHAIRAVVARERLEREVMGVAEAERQRVARDLHDGLGGRFTGIALLAEGLARRADDSRSHGADLVELATLAREGADEARRLARGLDPAPVEAGLRQALQGLAERTELSGPTCTFVFEGEEVPVDHETTLHLYHIAQEAVANALRHGAPGRVDIRLTVRAGTIALDVRDDGSGIPDNPEEGLGLRTMRQRATLLDAMLRVRPGPTGGTLVSCVVRRDRATPA